MQTKPKEQQQLFNVSLFPIPNLVAFPGTVVPLHVFEPRYRKMINECVENNVMLGVGHTRKIIRSAPANQELEQALKSNQATYQPHEIFSAGYCEIVETLDDGRIHVSVSVSKRLRKIKEVQTLPYNIVQAEEIIDTDAAFEDPEGQLTQQQSKINEELIRLAQDHLPALSKEFAKAQWRELSPGQFSYQVFEFIRFDADIMQEMLEVASIQERLNFLDSLLKEIE
jgi:Lon protease-like protein